MPRLLFRDCIIYSQQPLAEEELTVRVDGTLSGSTTAKGIVVANQNFSCNAYAEEGRFTAWLPGPGKYAVLYRVFNNFRRHMRDVEIVGSCNLDVAYDPPRMTVQIASLPARLPQGGMVYLRSSSGYKGRTVKAFSEFAFDFEYTPDLFLNGYDRVGLVVGEVEYQLPFRVVPFGALSLDFKQAREVPALSHEA